MKPHLLALSLLSLAGLASADGTQTQSPYERAADYSESKRGSSILVMKAGKVVFERYSGREPEDATQIFSGTKSFWGVAAMVAVSEGKLSLDELACETLSEWKGDPRKEKITVRQLLDLTSGLDPAGRKLRARTTTKKYETALGVSAVKDPGTTYAYGPSHFYAFGELLKRKLGGTSPLAYLKEKILDPIGLKVADWKHDAEKDPHMPAGASLNAREWVKFGELLRQGGSWQGKQLVPRELLQKCFQGSKPNPAYGLTFWLSAAGLDPLGAEKGVVGPKDLYFAGGFGNQRLYVFPTEQLVVVRQGKNHPGWSDEAFVALVLGKEPPSDEDLRATKAKTLVHKWFERWDKDQDGVVQGDETPRLRARAWSRWDTDSDGKLTKDEVQKVMERRLRLLDR